MSDANIVGEVAVRVRPKANPTQFERELEQQTKGAGARVGESLSSELAGALTAGAFVAFSAKIVASASNAEQAVGGVEAVFGDASDAINQFAEGSAEAIGLTEQATRQFTTQIGAALKGFGLSAEDAAARSIDLVTIGSDLAATFGGTVPDAVTALTASLRGEFDPLERFGVSLNAAAVGAKAVALGLADNASNVDSHAKAMATLALIQERTADAQGQFQRELDTTGGALSVATAKLGDAGDELGSVFLPLVAKGATAVAALADGLGALPSAIQAVIVGMVAMAAFSGPLGRLKDRVADLATGFREGGEAAGKFKAQLSGIAKAGIITAGLAEITGGIEAFKDATAQAGEDFQSSLPDKSDIQGYLDAVNEAVARQNELSDQLGQFGGGEDPSKVIDHLGASWNFFTSTVTGNVSAVGQAKAEYDALTAALPAATAKAQDLVDKVNELGTRLGVSGTTAADFVAKFKGLDITQVPMENLVRAFRDLEAGKDVAQVAQDLGVGVATAGDKAAEAAKKFDSLRDGLFGVTDAQHAYEDSIQGVADAQVSADRAQRSVTDAQRSYQASLESVHDAQISLQHAQQSTADAELRRVQSLQSVEDAVRGVEDAQRRLDEALSGPSESDSLDLEARKLRLEQQRKGLADIKDPVERRLAEIALRQAELDLAERQAEVDGQAAVAQHGLQTAQENLTTAQRDADAASRGVADAREAERDAVQGVSDANYNAQKAAIAITDAERNAEQASRDIERAKYDQLKASEDLTEQLGNEAAAIAGAKDEARQLEEHFAGLVALHPELAAAIQPLLDLLHAAGVNAKGSGQQVVAPQRNPDDFTDNRSIDQKVADQRGGRIGANNVTQINNFRGMDPDEAIGVANQRLALAVGW